MDTLENPEEPENKPLSNEESVKNAEMQCRICLDTNNPEDFISPCKCRGSQKLVHQACIKTWLLASEKYETEISSCEVCKANYNMEFNYSAYLAPCSENAWKCWVPFFIACVLSTGIMCFYLEGFMGGGPESMLIIAISIIFGAIALCCLAYSCRIVADVCLEFKITEWNIKDFEGV